MWYKAIKFIFSNFDFIPKCFFFIILPYSEGHFCSLFVHFYSLEWRKKFSTYSRIFCILLEFKVSCRILGVGSSSGSFFVPDARNSVVFFLRWFPGAPAVHYELNSVGFDALRITFRDTTSTFFPDCASFARLRRDL